MLPVLYSRMRFTRLSVSLARPGHSVGHLLISFFCGIRPKIKLVESDKAYSVRSPQGIKTRTNELSRGEWCRMSLLDSTASLTNNMVKQVKMRV